ncbi:Rv2231c family pyridoxal phosphate-dependent protein CobC [Streptomyces sp. JV185]|uniref:Rv2231c family pyridoxal phosphate-dependent protein CobC n=1 Tax=Streptomyces sp. JV185 TaxID=858638 RepID=UPI002E76801B|nr:Rv2231c family pyridoxal phosphate-dependent protein CobC [Streptomyces sp. JV185]MEE1770438.1 Rv2231c family pyridoxal phosphate-dependent protein CobC [Streptomyces sp. JV185]
MSEAADAVAVLRPATLAVGVGASRGAPADEVLGLVRDTLRGAGLPLLDVAELVTVDAKADEPGIVAAAAALGVPLRTYPAGELARVEVPGPSGAPLAAVGTPSVAEAAALAAGGELLVPKRKSAPRGRAPMVTCAVARRDPGGRADAADTPSGPGRCVEPGAGRIVVLPDSEERAGPPRQPVSRPDDDGPHPHTTAAMHTPTESPDATGAGTHDLRHHGDAEVRGRDRDLTDLAVNVRAGTPPAWLRDRISASLGSLAAYPDGRPARAAVAARHGLPVERVLLTAGAAEAFVLIARALPVRRPVVVHPQFTEPEAALRAAGHEVGRLLLRAEDGFRLDPSAVPEEADLVVVGNPTNPTSVLHPAAVLEQLARPGRTLVVDEAFMDAVPGERGTLCGRTDVPGLVVLRSLTKTWGLAGLRIGYVLAEPGTVRALEETQPLWPVSSPALTAAEACMEPRALAEAAAAAERIAVDRAHLVAGLMEFTEVRVAGPAEGPFVLVRLERAAEVRERLRMLGFAARRGDTFPGLGPEWLRLAVRDRVTTNRFLQAFDQALQTLGAAAR